MSKVTITYHAPKGDEKVVETRGVEFFDGHPVELDADDNADLIAKAIGNPFFEAVDEEGKPLVVKTRGKPGRKPKAIDPDPQA